MESELRLPGRCSCAALARRNREKLEAAMKESELQRTIRSIWESGPAVLGARWYFRSAAELGPRVRVWGPLAINNRGTLRIGERVRVVSTPARTEIGVGVGATLEIGRETFINYGCSIGATELIRIGPHCNLGSHAILMDNDFHSIEPERRKELPPSAPIVLEENVWLGVRAIILRGVTLGAGSVVAAGSVVSRDVEPRSLVGGIPARLIRKL